MATDVKCINLGRRHRKKKRRISGYQSNDRPVSCAHEDKVVRLRQWMKQKAGFRNRLAPYLFSDIGRGLMTKRAIRPGEVIVSLPHSLLITTKSILDSEIGHFIKSWSPKLSPQQCLTVFLIWEKHKYAASSWFPYIDLLPTSFTTPAYFSQTELSYLPKAVKVNAMKELEKLSSTYNEVQSFSRKHWNDFYKILTFDVYRWSWYVVNTRSVFYKSASSDYLSDVEPDTIALAPFLDLLNHSTHANIKAGFNADSNCYQIMTEDTYKANDQVFISYGCHSNQKLFVEYGFCVPDNPNDELEVLYDDIMKACERFAVEHLSKKLSVLQEHGLLKLLICTTEGISWKLMTVLKTLAMDWKQLQQWNQMFTDENAFPETVPIAHTLARFILQDYLAENNRLKQYVNQTMSSSDNSVHTDIVTQLAQVDEDILIASIPP